MEFDRVVSKRKMIRKYLPNSIPDSVINKMIKNAKKYGYILYSENCSEVMTLSPRNKHHAMVALASLAKFHGQYDRFQQLKQRYNLKLSSGQESLQSFNRFFNPELSLDSMLQQVRQMIDKTLNCKSALWDVPKGG